MGNRLNPNQDQIPIRDILNEADPKDKYDPINTIFHANISFESYIGLETALNQFMFLSTVRGSILKTSIIEGKGFATEVEIQAPLPNLLHFAEYVLNSKKIREAFRTIANFKTFLNVWSADQFVSTKILVSVKNKEIIDNEEVKNDTKMLPKRNDDSSGEQENELLYLSKEYIPSKSILARIYSLDIYHNLDGFQQFKPISMLMKHYYKDDIAEIITVSNKTQKEFENFTNEMIIQMKKNEENQMKMLVEMRIEMQKRLDQERIEKIEMQKKLYEEKIEMHKRLDQRENILMEIKKMLEEKK